jgi:hypothetical protein
MLAVLVVVSLVTVLYMNVRIIHAYDDTMLSKWNVCAAGRINQVGSHTLKLIVVRDDNVGSICRSQTTSQPSRSSSHAGDGHRGDRRSRNRQSNARQHRVHARANAEVVLQQTRLGGVLVRHLLGDVGVRRGSVLAELMVIRGAQRPAVPKTLGPARAAPVTGVNCRRRHLVAEPQERVDRDCLRRLLLLHRDWHVLRAEDGGELGRRQAVALRPREEDRLVGGRVVLHELGCRRHRLLALVVHLRARRGERAEQVHGLRGGHRVRRRRLGTGSWLAGPGRPVRGGRGRGGGRRQLHGRCEQLRLDLRRRRWRYERTRRLAGRPRSPSRGRRRQDEAAPGAALVLGARLAVLEPVEDVGVADRAVLLQAQADARDLVARRVHHARVEDGLQDPDLLRPRVPPRLRIRGPVFAACKRNQIISLRLDLDRPGRKQNPTSTEAWTHKC